MTINLFQTAEYKEIISEHLAKTIGYMFSEQQEFAIACEIKHLTFTPELPQSVSDSFKDTVLFIISGYTFESAKLEEGNFLFEAGFGEENFGSIVNIPLLAIKQILVGDHLLALNLAEHTTTESNANNDAKKNSMESLLNNPENQKLLKKRK